MICKYIPDNERNLWKGQNSNLFVYSKIRHLIKQEKEKIRKKGEMEKKRHMSQKEKEKKTHSFLAAWYRSECPLGNSSNPLGRKE